jgi:tetratricopeptide (TPR) repeat protein
MERKRRAAVSELEQVNALLAEGNAACRNDRYDAAIEVFEHAITIASATWGNHAYQLVYPLLGLARALGRGRGIESHPEIRRVLDLEERAAAIAEQYSALYEQQLARIVGQLGSTLRIAGRGEEALACLGKCVSISERVFSESRETASALEALQTYQYGKLWRPARDQEQERVQR